MILQIASISSVCNDNLEVGIIIWFATHYNNIQWDYQNETIMSYFYFLLHFSLNLPMFE